MLDIPDTTFEIRDPDRALDRLEKESAAFRKKVRHAYRELAVSEPHAVRIDANRDRHGASRNADAPHSPLCLSDGVR